MNCWRGCPAAEEAHLKRFGSFDWYEGDQQALGDETIMHFDWTEDVVDALGKGPPAVHKAIVDADVLPADWSGEDRTLATLGTMAVLERAMKDIPQS